MYEHHTHPQQYDEPNKEQTPKCKQSYQGMPFEEHSSHSSSTKQFRSTPIPVNYLTYLYGIVSSNYA